MNKAHQMATLSEYAYLTPQKFIQTCKTFTPSFHSAKGTQCYTLWDDNTLVFAFRGTELQLDDIKTDLDFLKEETSHGKVHSGFLNAYEDIKSKIKADYDMLSRGRNVMFTGHSLGAALATLAIDDVSTNPEDSLYTFGSPRVGGSSFVNQFNGRFKNTFRYRNENDIVTREPMALLGYRHVGDCYYYDGAGELSINPSWWKRFKEYGKGIWGDKLDAFHDHSVSNYVRLTK
jgi:triacylglycerol lipase